LTVQEPRTGPRQRKRSPRRPLGWDFGPGSGGEPGGKTLFYTFTLGMVAGSFTGLVPAIVGHSAAATKINLFFALNTLFTLGMLRADGAAHDAWRTNGMLYTEALAGVAALVLFAWLAGKVRGAEPPDR
jgi:hypothetical protein